MVTTSPLQNTMNLMDNAMLILKKTTKLDLETLFLIQSEPEGVWMAAFTPENPSDKKAYIEKWSEIITNPSIQMQTIWMEEKIVGSIVHFDVMEKTNISYSILREKWGKGIATEALGRFINNVSKRPLFARVAHDNVGSQRVLEKNGFQQIGKEKGFANARKKEIKEYVYQYEA